MNKARARLSQKYNVTSVYDVALTTVPLIIETARATTTMVTSSTTMKMMAAKETTTVPSMTQKSTIATTTTTMTTTSRLTTTKSTTLSTPRFSSTLSRSSPTTTLPPTITEPNTKIFRKHSQNNGLSNVINRGREKMSVTSTHSSINVFSTPLSEGNHRIVFQHTTPTSTTRRPVFLANSKSRSPKTTTPPQGKNKFYVSFWRY